MVFFTYQHVLEADCSRKRSCRCLLAGHKKRRTEEITENHRKALYGVEQCYICEQPFMLVGANPLFINIAYQLNGTITGLKVLTGEANESFRNRRS